jgi:hypothetical protein
MQFVVIAGFRNPRSLPPEDDVLSVLFAGRWREDSTVNSHWQLFRISTALAGVFASTVAAYPDSATSDMIEVYCKKFFPNSLSSAHESRTVPVCFNPENGKMRFRHIDFAVACELTSGSPRFHYIDGFKIGCGSKPHTYIPRGPNVRLLKPEDLEKYCAQALGPGARPAFSSELKRTVCTGAAAPGPNPLTINYAFACSLTYKADNVRYVDGGSRDYVACVD